MKIQTERIAPKPLTCNHRDRDNPNINCGYPLPCPFHTTVIDLTSKPATVVIPVTSSANARVLRTVAKALEAALTTDTNGTK